MPRTPCQNLSLRVGEEGFHLRFNASGRVGALLRVLESGTVRAGDEVTVVTRPGHGVTVADLATGPDAARMQATARLRGAAGPQGAGPGPAGSPRGAHGQPGTQQ